MQIYVNGLALFKTGSDLLSQWIHFLLGLLPLYFLFHHFQWCFSSGFCFLFFPQPCLVNENHFEIIVKQEVYNFIWWPSGPKVRTTIKPRKTIKVNPKTPILKILQNCNIQILLNHDKMAQLFLFTIELYGIQCQWGHTHHGHWYRAGCFSYVGHQ